MVRKPVEDRSTFWRQLLGPYVEEIVDQAYADAKLGLHMERALPAGRPKGSKDKAKRKSRAVPVFMQKVETVHQCMRCGRQCSKKNSWCSDDCFEQWLERKAS